MRQAAPSDQGLQAERTLLAWRRTALALAVACAVAVRVTAAQLGPIAGLGGLIGLLLSSAVLLMAARRYRQVHRAMAADQIRLGIGGLAVAAVFGTAASLGLSALLLLIIVAR